MLGQEECVDIHVMHRQGMSIMAIGRELGVSRNTILVMFLGKVPEIQALFNNQIYSGTLL